MSIDAIDWIAADTPATRFTGVNIASDAPNFATWLAQEIDTVNQQIAAADVQVQRLVTGEQDNLHQVMSTLEKAKLGMQLVVEVRNKLLESYQEVMRMQV
ncbi:flagellar hook-basal body complex protein FliE [Exilibacterium tricleocarpae]|uniref:Flagellar hook-basal body complex protein FliE n=1 Tax=Exilibacterium tricleocarpae TaxID=2591008 RepID=A0A545T872_9GAMM|nr:flagellar hook-basal body complex protein FliE [Exilibacterium tricleocarpae]TQV73409.1 flagellar hook-basal body complex protein FliE [Exilibacterium tricleocarpae]